MLDLSHPVHISAEKYLESPEIWIKPNDIILVKTGSIGRVAVVDHDIGQACINPNVALLKPMSGLEPKYIWAYITTKSCQE
jgi:hypothetical protein